MKKISIAIITYQRPLSLKKLLLSLTEQKIDSTLSVSIIIVDNDTSNAAKDTVDSLTEYPFNINLNVEEKRGIVSARNRAVSEFLKTDSEILIFIDDDEWPVNNDWLENLLKVQKDYEADFVYSDVQTIPETPEIAWVKTAFQIEQKKQNILPIKKFYTNNLLIMRKVLEVLNPPFDERFSITGSEDLHFSIRANNLNLKAYYTSNAPVQETFFESRATLKWFFLRGYRIGESSTRAYLYEGHFPKVYFFLLFLFFGRVGRILQTFIKGIITWDKGYFAKSYMYLGTSIGTVLGFFNLQYNEYNKTHGK